MSLPASLRNRLRLPLIAAPMFLVSGPALVTAACRAGIVGSFPTANCRTVEELDSWLAGMAESSRRAADADGDALDQDALKIKEYKWQAQNRFKCRVDNIAGMDRYSSRNITNLKGRLKSINSLNDGKSYVANAMNAIDSMLRDVENAIRSRNDRIYEINQQLCTYEDNIEQLRIKKRRMESK